MHPDLNRFEKQKPETLTILNLAEKLFITKRAKKKTQQKTTTFSQKMETQKYRRTSWTSDPSEHKKNTSKESECDLKLSPGRPSPINQGHNGTPGWDSLHAPGAQGRAVQKGRQ